MSNVKYEQLTFADDFMFCKVLQHHPELCKELLELILGHPLGSLIEIGQQETIRITEDRKGVRFDIYAKDDQSVVYDVEMQNAKKADLPRRARYAQSLMDLEQLERGANYKELKQSYVIYICNFKLFSEYDRSKYTFRTLCLEDTGIELGDGVERIFLCTEGSGEGISREMQQFLDYVAGNEAGNEFTCELENAVRTARRNARWRKEFMDLQDYIDDAREEGIRIGHEEGLAEGRAEECANTQKERCLREAAEAEILKLKAQLAALQSSANWLKE